MSWQEDGLAHLKELRNHIKERLQLELLKLLILLCLEKKVKVLEEERKNNMGYRQIIIARKDLNMSAGKLAAQVSHASMAFLTTVIRKNADEWPPLEEDGNRLYRCFFFLDAGMYENWIEGSFTKTICEAKNRNHLMKATSIAAELGLKEGVDYFLIRDNCLTELTPEDDDGRTLTAIGFVPLPDEVAHKISKKFQLYR